MDNGAPRIVCITAGGPCPWAIINHLGDVFGPVTVLIEQPEQRSAFIRRRAKKIGWMKVAGQFPAMLWVKFGKHFVKKRSQEIIDTYKLEVHANSQHTLINVNSSNSHDGLAIVRQINPDVVFLAGCRIMSRFTLSQIKCPVINYHSGISPKYRGMNCGYFALANNDARNFGTTVHLVDAGVDTGGILYQQRIEDTSRDSILTYALLMAAHSREICAKAVSDALNDICKPQTVDLPSQQWFHPPIWAYVWTGLTKSIW